MVESDFKPVKWVTVPEHHDPVDDNEEFRLTVTKCPIFEIESQTANIQGSQIGRLNKANSNGACYLLMCFLFQGKKNLGRHSLEIPNQVANNITAWRPTICQVFF
jgi:hypothetical protein